MNLLGILLTAVLVVLVFACPRRVAVLAVFASVCYITQGVGVTFVGFHFFAHRIVLLAGLVRILARGELQSLKLNRIDWVLVAFAIVLNLLPAIRSGVWQEQAGNAYNILLSYFLFRCLVTSWEDVQDLLPKLALLIVPLALCMIYESRTGASIFSAMGGQDAEILREGRYRCIGAFRGPHTAGVLGATLMPLFVGLYFLDPRRRAIAVIGAIAATAITYASNSSGPLLAFLSGLIGLACWRLRGNMRRVRWAIVGALVLLALVMKAPIWYILAKISDITGGDGWFRSYLMEQCFKHFFDWWLIGTDQTANWAATQMPWGGADMCNLYVSCAAAGGLTALVLVILLLVRCFSNLGLALQSAPDPHPQSAMLLWCMGSVLFAHVCTLFSVTYWDQFFVIWWGFLAMISSVTSSILAQPAPQLATDSVARPSTEEIPA